jgi:hypothetical protein
MITKKFRNTTKSPRYLCGVEIPAGEIRDVKGDRERLEGHPFVRRGALVDEDASAPKGRGKGKAQQSAPESGSTSEAGE